VVWEWKHGTARLISHGASGWAACGAAMAAAMQLAGVPAPLIAHSFIMPAMFAVAWHYFRVGSAYGPLAAAAAWTAIVVVPDFAAVAVGVFGAEIFTSAAGTWLPLALGFISAWATGAALSAAPQTSGPTPRAAAGRGSRPPEHHDLFIPA
jgi:hypothetical protein